MNSRKLVKLALAGISAIAVSSAVAASANVSGKVQLDYANNSGLASAFATKQESASWDFATVRLVVSGKLSDDVSHYVRLEKSGDPINFSQGYITYTGLEGLSLRLGKHTMQYGHENWRDGAGLNILSYAFDWGHTSGAQMGLTASGSSDSMSFAVGMFQDNTAEGDKTKYGMTGRVVFSPSVGEGMFSSVGLSYQTRPKQSVVASGAWSRAANGQKYHSWDVDAALAMGPFGAVAEYDNKSVSNTYDGDDKRWMVELTYILTGQNRSHSGKWGTLDGVKTEGRPAFDVGFVYSKADSDNSYVQGAANDPDTDAARAGDTDIAYFTTAADGKSLATAALGDPAGGTVTLGDGTVIKGKQKKTSWLAGVGYQMQDNLRFQLTYASQKFSNVYKVHAKATNAGGAAVDVGTEVYKTTTANASDDGINTGSGLNNGHQKANSYKLRVEYVF